jgi:hypothetical protein
LTHKTAAAQDSQSRNTDRITGVVVNSLTHEPIGRALVVSTDERFATMTDSYGHFEFTLPQGNAVQGPVAGIVGSGSPGVVYGINRPYALTARKPGFLAESDEPVQVWQGTSAVKDITIPLVPEALIVGHVALPTSEAPDSIEVELYQRKVRNGRAHWVSVGVQATRSSGEFRFAGLTTGTFKLLTHESMDRNPQITAPGGQMYGYAPVYFPGANAFASAESIELTPGKTVHANVSLVRQPYYPIKVPVANAPPGVPLDITVSLQGHDGPGYSLGYNAQELVIGGSLPNGSYRLEAVGYEPNGGGGSTIITVRGGPVEGPTLMMVPGSTIEVHVKEEFTSSDNTGSGSSTGPPGRFRTQGPRADVQVSLEPADDFGIQRGVPSRPPSNSQGDSIVLENVPPGRYWVQIYPRRGYVSSVTSGSANLLHKPLVVTATGSVPAIEVTLRDDGAQLEGTIEDPNLSSGISRSTAAEASGQTMASLSSPNARVYCIPTSDSSGRYTEVNVSLDGTFTASLLPPGEYRLLAFKRRQPELEYENPEAMRAYDGKGHDIRLSAGQKEKVQLQWTSTSE